MLVPLPGVDGAWVDLAELPRTLDTSPAMSMLGVDVHVKQLKESLAHWLTESCDFYFVLADKLRAATAAELDTLSLPLQEVRKKSPQWIVKLPVAFDKACKGAYAKEYLAVSHRWETPTKPDTTGAQLVELRKHLDEHLAIKYVWVDVLCLPQGERTPTEKAEFSLMLPNIDLLFIGASVLIMLDRAYSSRFWTCFEAWLSLNTATADGLRGAHDSGLRSTIVCLHHTSPYLRDGLLDEWRGCSAQQAHDKLSSPDVDVTNKSDKTMQLPKISQLDARVRRLMQSAEAREVVELRGLLAGGPPSHRGSSRVGAPPSVRGGAAPEGPSLAQKVSRIKTALLLDASLPMPVAISQANTQMGLPSQSTLPDQADALIRALGIKMASQLSVRQ
jgi:hypothetical protein